MLEQKELAEKSKALVAELENAAASAMTADLFIATVRKYTRAKKLTERMLNELIERIVKYIRRKRWTGCRCRGSPSAITVSAP